MTLNCKVCHIKYDDDDDPLSHQHSLQHRFNLLLHLYNRHKSRFMAEGKDILDFKVTLNGNPSLLVMKYEESEILIQTSLPGFRSAQKVSVRVVIQNVYTTPITILSVNFLHPYSAFNYDDVTNVLRNEMFPLLEIGATYALDLNFYLAEPVVGHFKNTFNFTFQVPSRNRVLYVNRDFVIKISENSFNEAECTKSPFTNKDWGPVQIVSSASGDNELLQKYVIPVDLAEIFFSSFQLEDLSESCHLQYNVIKYVLQALNPGNYSQFFHYLLWLDEAVELMNLTHYNMEEVYIKVLAPRLFEIDVPGLAEKRPSIIKNDIIIMRRSNANIAYEGIVTKITNESIWVQHLDEKFMEAVAFRNDHPMDVHFRINRLNYVRKHEALENCEQLLPTLFPPDSLRHRRYNGFFNLSDEELYNKNIVTNREQKQAVISIINGFSKPAPYVVFGPPGTGKTVTIVEAILQIKQHLRHANILICAPSNAACNMLTLKLKDHCAKRDMIRIHSRSQDWNLIPTEILKFSNVQNGEFVNISATDIRKYRIVITTLILIGKYRETYRPDFVFIDEAAQAAEPEALVALSLMAADGQAVLCGDPKQLGPICYSKVALAHGLGISLLERLCTNYATLYESSNFMIMLKQNFRSHELILSIPNLLFYDDLLQACSLNAQNDPISRVAIYKLSFPYKVVERTSPNQAVEFCAIQGQETREGSSPSYFNKCEVEAVVKYVETLLKTSFDNTKVEEKDIGVITPYIRQVYKIRGYLASLNFKHVEVGTTETYQGREKRVIIMSTVRAHANLLHYDKQYKLGFIGCGKRFNVAITRAMSKLIIVGNPHVLTYSTYWLALIRGCQQNGAYFGAPFAERTDELMATVMRRLKL